MLSPLNEKVEWAITIAVTSYCFGVCGWAEDPEGAAELDDPGQAVVPRPILLTLIVWDCPEPCVSPITATDSPMCDERTETFAFDGKLSL